MEEQRTLKEIVRYLLRGRATAFGLALLGLFTVAAVFAPWLSPADPNRMSLAMLAPPGLEHPFGTDDFGRDLFSRVLYGLRVSLRVGALVSLISGIVGTLLGVSSASNERVDNLIMRGLDAVMAFPIIIVALAIMAVLGPGELNAILAISIVYSPQTARLVRSRVLSLKEESFVEAARSLGASDIRLIWKHILPNCVSILIVQQTLVFAYAVLVEAALSFLGVGTPPPSPSLGGILNESRDFLRTAPWMSLFSGSVIALCVLAVNLVGDGLRDILDPKSASRIST